MVMITCAWYSVEEKQPDNAGYYLAFKGMTFADDQTDTGYYYWNASQREWRESGVRAHYANVIYWTDADPEYWYSHHHDCKPSTPITPAEKDAWDAMQLAIEKYKMVKALTAKTSKKKI
jgi:hypothetical protein